MKHSGLRPLSAQNSHRPTERIVMLLDNGESNSYSSSRTQIWMKPDNNNGISHDNCTHFCAHLDIIIIIIIIIITAVKFSLGGSSVYNSTDKTNTKYT
jgi:hypothetical protein